MFDPISDLIIRIKNAQKSGASSVRLPSSRLKRAILEVMKKEGFIDSIQEIKAPNKKYKNTIITFTKKRIIHIRRISKPGHRKYVSNKNIPTPLRGLGLIIISTSKGIITGAEAKKVLIGGELICEMW